MRIFDHPNKCNNWKCPICNTDEDLPVTLIPIAKKSESENISEAVQVHVKCLDIIYLPEYGIFFMKL